MAPRNDLATILEQLATDAGVDVNVYGAPPASLAVPALMIRPDTPWRATSPELPFGHTAERYAVVAIVAASGDTGDLFDTLRQLVVLVEQVQDGKRPWKWTETTGVLPAALGGIDYLGTTVRMTYLEG